MEKEKEDKVEESEEQEESELEEDIEEAEHTSLQNSDVEEAEQEISEDKFVEFMTPSSESFSTALGQVGVAPELRATDLEQDTSNIIACSNVISNIDVLPRNSC